jgi:release factor glutamine methyltransferase
MNIQDAINLGIKLLTPQQDKHGARTDVEYLLVYLLNKSFTWLKTWPEFELSNEQVEKYQKLLRRREAGEPIAYITGEKNFWTLALETNASTLIPRSETELLVETALAFLADKNQAKILDLGTGTGAIALSIASERLNDSVFACDFNHDAVKLAASNAKKNHINNVKILQSNWFDNIDQYDFDLIISNPPYIKENDPHLQLGDLVYEPESALVSADEGLADIKLITQQSLKYFSAGGGLMFEHGFEQAQAVRDILSHHQFNGINTINDLAGLERVTIGFYTGSTIC